MPHYHLPRPLVAFLPQDLQKRASVGHSNLPEGDSRPPLCLMLVSFAQICWFELLPSYCCLWLWLPWEIFSQSIGTAWLVFLLLGGWVACPGPPYLFSIWLRVVVCSGPQVSGFSSLQGSWGLLCLLEGRISDTLRPLGPGRNF